MNCQIHEYPQGQRLKERFKFNFQIRNQKRLCDQEIKTQKLRTRTQDVQDQHGNKYLLC